MGGLISSDKRIVYLYFIGALLAFLILNMQSLAIVFPFAVLFFLATLISPDIAFFSIIASIPVALEIGGGLTVTTAVMPMAILFLMINASVNRCSWPITLTGKEAKFALCFFISIVVSAFLSAKVGHAIKDGLVTVVFFIIFFATLTFIKNETDLKRLLWVLTITGIVEAIITVAQVKIGFTFPGKWRLTNMETSDFSSEFRADGTTPHPILLAHFLQLSMATAIAQIMWNKVLWIRLFLGFGFVLMLIAWYYAYSRSSFIAMGLTLGLAIFMRGKVWRYSILLAGIFGVLMIFAMQVESIQDLLQRIESMSFFSSSVSNLNINPSGDSYGFRIEQFVASGWLFLDYPFFGVGFDQAIRHYMAYLPPWATNYFHPQVIHNIFIQVMCELGVVGSIAFVGLWVFAFRAIIRSWSHEQYAPYSKLIFLILVGQLVMGSMNPMMREIWLSLAMAIAVGKLAVPKKISNPFDETGMDKKTNYLETTHSHV